MEPPLFEEVGDAQKDMSYAGSFGACSALTVKLVLSVTHNCGAVMKTMESAFEE